MRGRGSRTESSQAAPVPATTAPARRLTGVADPRSRRSRPARSGPSQPEGTRYWRSVPGPAILGEGAQPPGSLAESATGSRRPGAGGSPPHPECDPVVWIVISQSENINSRMMPSRAEGCPSRADFNRRGAGGPRLIQSARARDRWMDEAATLPAGRDRRPRSTPVGSHDLAQLPLPARASGIARFRSHGPGWDGVGLTATIPGGIAGDSPAATAPVLIQQHPTRAGGHFIRSFARSIPAGSISCPPQPERP